jgi:amino acid adenylation domain-containing protein
MAAALVAGGVRGGRVGLLLERDEDLLPAMLGTLRAGAAYVPLDPAFPAERLAFMVEDSQLVRIVTKRRLAADFAAAIAATPVLCLDEPLPAASAAIEETRPATSSDADAYVLYTSGSTGKPKGVRVRHRNVVNFLTAFAREPGLSSRDVVVAMTTLTFDIAVFELLLPLTVGAEIVLVSRDDSVDGVALGQLMARHGVTFVQATPSRWRLLLEAGWAGKADVKALCGGEALPRELVAALLPKVSELWNAYGPTETTVYSSLQRIASPDGPILIGRPIANTTMHVLDEDRQTVPVGVVGELYIGGDGVSAGYLNRPELTAQRFVAVACGSAPAAPLYRTGDLARWCASGALDYLGRTDFQVKIRGYRIELGEIEGALLQHPDVAQATVAAREDRPGEVRLIGYFVARDGSPPPSEDALRGHLARGLPDYMIPQRFVPLAAMPLTGSGKVNRKALPAPSADVAGSADKVRPRTPREREIAAAFAEALGVDDVGIDQDFFLLGGHSLLAAQMASRLARVLGHPVPMRLVFEHPTVARLAAALASTGTAPATQVVPRRAERSKAPLSLMQQRVWYLEQLQLGRTVFNVPSAHRLRGELDVAALMRAFGDFVSRQPALRTVIRNEDGEPMQVVLDTVDSSIAIEDLSRNPEAEREKALFDRLAEETSRPFELREPPLFRARLFRLDPHEHVLFFMPHHAVFDGWSFDVFYSEMSELYEAHRTGREPHLEPLPVDYGDFAAWHRAWMDGPELARQLAFWKHKLTGAPPSLDLPLDKPRPPIQTGDGATEWLRIDSSAIAALRALAARDGATLYMALLTAWSVLLARLSGQQEVVIGTPVRGRNLPELENVVGFFVNALPMRLSVDGERSFVDAMRGVRAEVVDAFGHQDVPFEHLVRILDVGRDESRFPIYQAFFSYQDARQRPTMWGNLRHANVPIFQPSAAQDLALWFLEDRNELVGGLNYNTDVLSPATAELIRARFTDLVARIAERPDAPLRTLWGPTRAENDRLRELNDTKAALPHASTITELIGPALVAAGDRIAIRFGAATVSYRELRESAKRFAAALTALGVGAGDVVGLHLDRTPAMLAAVLGTLESGATFLPLDPAFPPERLRFMLEDSGARVVICNEGSEPPGFPKASLLHAEHLAAPSGKAAAPGSSRAEWADAPAAERPAYLLYTSGSTGKPKGVLVPHRAVVNFLTAMRDEPGLDSTAKLAAVTTLSFDIAVLELLLPLTVGAQIVLATREQASDGHELRKLIEQHRVDTLQATPSSWRLLIEAGWRGSSDFKALCGGEALSAELADELLQRTGQLWNMYGPTETTVWSTCGRIEPGQGAISIGKPIANTEVHVLDERGDPVPIGVVGEIHIGGAGVALGYHLRPELTAERFVPDPSRRNARLYRTGDLGRWRGDGRLECLGRTDFQVKVRGHRIELGEIETALGRHAAIKQAAVIAIADNGGDAELVAYAVTRDGATPAAAELRESLQRELPAYMVPARFVFLPRLPLTPNGKVDRKALPKPAAGIAADTRLIAGAPRTDEEKLIAEVWRQLLRIEQISVHDNFLDLGGHSLMIMRAIARIETEAGVRLAPRAFIFQTLEQIAAELAKATVAATGSSSSVDGASGSGGIVQRVARVIRRMF